MFNIDCMHWFSLFYFICIEMTPICLTLDKLCQNVQTNRKSPPSAPCFDRAGGDFPDSDLPPIHKQLALHTLPARLLSGFQWWEPENMSERGSLTKQQLACHSQDRISHIVQQDRRVQFPLCSQQSRSSTTHVINNRKNTESENKETKRIVIFVCLYDQHNKICQKQHCGMPAKHTCV